PSLNPNNLAPVLLTQFVTSFFSFFRDHPTRTRPQERTPCRPTGYRSLTTFIKPLYSSGGEAAHEPLVSGYSRQTPRPPSEGPGKGASLRGYARRAGAVSTPTQGFTRPLRSPGRPYRRGRHRRRPSRSLGQLPPRHPCY